MILGVGYLGFWSRFCEKSLLLRWTGSEVGGGSLVANRRTTQKKMPSRSAAWQMVQMGGTAGADVAEQLKLC